jgi:hypothetical protein
VDVIVVARSPAALKSHNIALYGKPFCKMRLDEDFLDTEFSTLGGKPFNGGLGSRLIQTPIGEQRLEKFEILSKGQDVATTCTGQRRAGIRLLESEIADRRSRLPAHRSTGFPLIVECNIDFPAVIMRKVGQERRSIQKREIGVESQSHSPRKLGRHMPGQGIRRALHIDGHIISIENAVQRRLELERRVPAETRQGNPSDEGVQKYPCL